MVLFIIMLLLAAALPAMQTAFVEKAVRNDSHELALMVKTATLQSVDEHRAYVIELTRRTMTLHPVADPESNDDTKEEDAPDDKTISYAIDSSNQIQLPDPEKPKHWLPVTATSWLFRPGALCPAPRVRLVRGNAWVVLGFNALTGNAEEEDAFFP